MIILVFDLGDGAKSIVHFDKASIIDLHEKTAAIRGLAPYEPDGRLSEALILFNEKGIGTLSDGASYGVIPRGNFKDAQRLAMSFCSQ